MTGKKNASACKRRRFSHGWQEIHSTQPSKPRRAKSVTGSNSDESVQPFSNLTRKRTTETRQLKLSRHTHVHASRDSQDPPPPHASILRSMNQDQPPVTRTSLASHTRIPTLNMHGKMTCTTAINWLQSMCGPTWG